MLVSNDISHSRAKALLKNLELFGVRNAIVLSESPEHLADKLEEEYRNAIENIEGIYFYDSY